MNLQASNYFYGNVEFKTYTYCNLELSHQRLEIVESSIVIIHLFSTKQVNQCIKFRVLHLYIILLLWCKIVSIDHFCQHLNMKWHENLKKIQFLCLYINIFYILFITSTLVFL